MEEITHVTWNIPKVVMLFKEDLSLQDNIFDLKYGFFVLLRYIFSICCFLFLTTLSLLGHGEGTRTYLSELNVSPGHHRALYEHMVVCVLLKSTSTVVLATPPATGTPPKF